MVSGIRRAATDPDRDGMVARMAPSLLPLGGLATATLYPLRVILSTAFLEGSVLETGARLLFAGHKALCLAMLRSALLALPRCRVPVVSLDTYYGA